jgi:hypothetical protein
MHTCLLEPSEYKAGMQTTTPKHSVSFHELHIIPFPAYYSQTAPPIELTQQNPLCRFKAIGYSCMPSSDNAQGLVALTFNKKEEEIRFVFLHIQIIIQGMSFVHHVILFSLHFGGQNLPPTQSQLI